jgi:hypothetical protein
MIASICIPREFAVATKRRRETDVVKMEPCVEIGGTETNDNEL